MAVGDAIGECCHDEESHCDVHVDLRLRRLQAPSIASSDHAPTRIAAKNNTPSTTRHTAAPTTAHSRHDGPRSRDVGGTMSDATALPWDGSAASNPIGKPRPTSRFATRSVLGARSSWASRHGSRTTTMRATSERPSRIRIDTAFAYQGGRLRTCEVVHLGRAALRPHHLRVGSGVDKQGTTPTGKTQTSAVDLHPEIDSSVKSHPGPTGKTIPQQRPSQVRLAPRFGDSGHLRQPWPIV